MGQGLGLRRRLLPIVGGFVTVAAGLATRSVLSGFVAKYLGVALWATLVYFLVLFVRPSLTVRRAALITIAISFFVETFQLTPIPMWLYQNVHPILAWVLGTTFNVPDFPAYVVGALLGALAHALGRRLSVNTVVLTP